MYQKLRSAIIEISEENCQEIIETYGEARSRESLARRTPSSSTRLASGPFLIGLKIRFFNTLLDLEIVQGVGGKKAL